MSNIIIIGMDLGDKFHMAVVFDNDGKESKIGKVVYVCIDYGSPAKNMNRFIIFKIRRQLEFIRAEYIQLCY